MRWAKGAYGQLLNYFHASLKLDRLEREAGKGAACLRTGPNTLGAGAGQRGGDRSHQATAARAQGPFKPLRPERNGGAQSQADLGDPSKPQLRKPVLSMQKRQQRKSNEPSTAGGRELRLKARPPARFSSLRSTGKVNQKQEPSGNTLLAQRYPLSGNSYFWRKGGERVERVGACGACGAFERPRPFPSSTLLTLHTLLTLDTLDTLAPPLSICRRPGRRLCYAQRNLEL